MKLPCWQLSSALPPVKKVQHIQNHHHHVKLILPMLINLTALPATVTGC